MKKIIFHIDINAFFSTVEEILNPKLKTKPIAVCGYNKKAVISSCNYIARQYGVKAAMKADEAKVLCPNIIFVDNHTHLYKKFSNKFINYISTKYSSKIEIGSIDECYVDVTHLIEGNHNNPEILAIQIRNDIFKKLELPVSIGISDNMFLSKIASDIKKPFGIYSIFSYEIEKKLLPLNISKYVGIGSKSVQILNSLGINTIKDFKEYDKPEELKKIFKNQYKKIMGTLNGNNEEYQFIKNSKNKSISKAITLYKDEYDIERIISRLYEIVEDVNFEIERKKYVGYTITVSIKYINKVQKSKSKTFDNAINSKNLFNVSKDIFFDLWDENPIRYLSVGISKLNSF